VAQPRRRPILPLKEPDQCKQLSDPVDSSDLQQPLKPPSPSRAPVRNQNLNINAFATPAPFAFGNTYELSSTRICPYLNENMSLVKSFPIKERVKAVVGVNAFNMFNRHQWLSLQTNIGVPSFGKFTSASTPRTVQLYGKITF
jgi:hypothetical protein